MEERNKLENPFPLVYNGAAYFCDRKTETEQLLSNINNGMSTTILSIRRIGKTGIMQHVLSKLPKNFIGIYIDILETENLNQFLNLLSSSILNAVPEKKSWTDKIYEFFKALRPVVSFDQLSGMPQITFDIKPAEAEVSIKSVLQFLDQLEFKIVIAIDEFQQILTYPEKKTDAWLRAQIQQLKNVVFLFSGSQQHLMAEIFSSPKRPFYRSTQMLKLEKIQRDEYISFIEKMFNNYEKEIVPPVINEMLDWTNVHTYYVQQLCNRVFSETTKKASSETWKNQALLLLKEQENVFFTYRNMLTAPQWRLLKAMAFEGQVYQPSAGTFLNKHQLGTSATVLRSLKTLLEYELVFKEFNERGNSYYSVYDVLFQRWAQSKM